MTTLSIIIPVFNTEKYIARCIDSILNQTFLDWELIIIDDGSSDNSLTICNNYATHDNRITVLAQKNSGQGKARNLGISKAYGRYIAFLDSDDLLLDNNTFLYAVEFLNKNQNVDIVQFPFVRFNDNNFLCEPYKHNFIINHKNEIIEHTDILNMISHSDPIIKTSPWAKVFRRDLFNHTKFPEGIIYEDTFMFCDMVPYINAIAMIDCGLYGNFERKDSTTLAPLNAKKAFDKIVTLVKVYHTLCKYSKNKDLKRKMRFWVLKIAASLNAKFNTDDDFKNNLRSLLRSTFPPIFKYLNSVLETYYRIRFRFL